MEQQFAVIVTKPGHDTVRIGPIPWEHQADSMSASLNQQLYSTAAPEGTHSASAPYDPKQPHLPLLTLDVYSLAEQMTTDPDGDPEARFPDLYSRFAAQIGYDERGPAMWSTACNYADAMNAEPDEGDTLTRHHLPKKIHNPTKRTPWPMSDRDWLSMVYAYSCSRLESMGAKTWKPEFDDPDLPTTGPALIAMWLGLQSVRNDWVEKVGSIRATKWRNAHSEQKGIEFRHAALWAVGGDNGAPVFFCRTEEEAAWYLGQVGYESLITRVLHRELPGGEWSAGA